MNKKIKRYISGFKMISKRFKGMLCDLEGKFLNFYNIFQFNLKIFLVFLQKIRYQ